MKAKQIQSIKWILFLIFLFAGKSILFAQFPYYYYDIYMYDLKKGTTIQVSSIPDSGEFNPSWSPNSKKIAHEAVMSDTYGNWYQNLYITDVQTGVSTLLMGGFNGNDVVWSPDGTNLIFDLGWPPSLFSLPVTGGVSTLIRENGLGPDWSPDGSHIVFLDTDSWYIKSMRLSDGYETFIAFEGENPVWAPNGHFIAYDDWYGGIFIVKIDDNANPIGDPIRLTNTGSGPSWMNNSKSIFFTDNPEGQFYIYSIPVTGGTEVKVCGLETPDGNFDACVSNNGNFVAFAGETMPLLKNKLVATPDGGNLQVNIAKNPSSGDFSLTFNSITSTTISLYIYDDAGKIILNQPGIQPNSTLKVGNDFSKGVYFAVICQGKQRKIIKLLKQ
ncbi:MAG: T9SS type A sorting domain-containing protein [Bacteroidota bacterium]|nr:T9SS type A sorting domain-containing protein [Bacteroidota bacterium]